MSTDFHTPRLPEMSRHEASWHEHQAGLRASERARHTGGDQAAIAALATATAGPRQIGPHTLRPASQGTLWTLQRIAREFATYAETAQLPASGNPEAPGTRELIELGLATLAFCDARDTWRALDRGDIAGLIEKAESLMWETPLETQMQLQNFFTGEMDRIKTLSPGDEEPKKPQPPQAETQPPGASPAMPTPPLDPPSPPANGWPPNTP